MPLARHLVLAAQVLAFGLLVSGSAAAQSSAPAFTPKTDEFDFVKREEMIPMRDGVKLKTFILMPKGASGAPMLLTRTPYNASSSVARFASPHLRPSCRRCSTPRSPPATSSCSRTSAVSTAPKVTTS